LEIQERDISIRLPMPRTKRSLSLIVKFVDGYADGWFFAVGEYFKDQLDIRFTERIEPELIDGQIQYGWVKKNEKTRKRKLTKKVFKWTQGNAYSFAQGHVLYDSKLAKRLIWKEAMKHISLVCQVTSATSDLTDEKGYFIHGSVHFDLLRPDEHKKTLITDGQYHLSQHDFVNFLKTGSGLPCP